MRAQIEKVFYEKQDILVKFSSDFGNAVAYWSEKKPTINSNYQVEIDISGVVEWGKEALLSDNNIEAIYLKNDNVFISGSIESIDEDGYTTVRLGNSIISFLTTGIPFQVGAYITLSTKKITLSPVEY
jgi:hypothetical protein